MKPTLEEIKNNIDKTLVRLSDGTICGLKQFKYKNNKEYIGVVSLPYWYNDFSVNTVHEVGLDKAYNRQCFISAYNIDAICFVSNSAQVEWCLNHNTADTIKWDWDINNPHNLKVKIGDNGVTCDQMDAYEYAIQQLGLNNNPHNRDYIIKGEKQNMMNGILEIYEEKQSRKINKKYDDLEQSIKLTDERYKTWLECTTTLTNLYKEDNVFTSEHFAPIQLSKDTLAKLHTLGDTREEDLRKLCEKRREVQSQLDMCDTYDQKQEILRRYNIINKNGKVNG